MKQPRIIDSETKEIDLEVNDHSFLLASIMGNNLLMAINELGFFFLMIFVFSLERSVF